MALAFKCFPWSSKVNTEQEHDKNSHDVTLQIHAIRSSHYSHILTIGPNGLTFLLAAASLAVGPHHLTEDIFGEHPSGFCHLGRTEVERLPITWIRSVTMTT